MRLNSPLNVARRPAEVLTTAINEGGAANWPVIAVDWNKIADTYAQAVRWEDGPVAQPPGEN